MEIEVKHITQFRTEAQDKDIFVPIPFYGYVKITLKEATKMVELWLKQKGSMVINVGPLGVILDSIS